MATIYSYGRTQPQLQNLVKTINYYIKKEDSKVKLK